MNERYNVEQAQLSRTPSSTSGFYYERMVRSFTKQSVIAIDRFDNRIYIPPLPYASATSPNIQITQRSIVNEDDGFKRNKTGRDSSDPNLTGVIITIPEWELTNSPVFVEEVDLLFALASHAPAAMHPARAHIYSNVLDSAISLLTGDDLCFTMRVFANDPTGEIKELFIHQFGKTMPVAVTNFQHNDAIVTFVFSRDMLQTHRYSINLQDIAKGDGIIELGSGFNVAIGISEEQIQTGLANLLLRLNTSPETIDKRVAALSEKHKEELAILKKELEIKIKNKELEIASLKSDLQAAQDEGNRYKTYAEKWQGYSQAELEKSKQVNEAKTSDQKVTISELSVREKELQYWGTVLKVVGGLAIAGLTWWVKTQVDDYRSRK